MSGSLLLACGCKVAFRENAEVICPVHGPSRVVRTVRMPRPRIRGVATGPLVQTMDLGPWTGRIVGSDAKE